MFYVLSCQLVAPKESGKPLVGSFLASCAFLGLRPTPATMAGLLCVMTVEIGDGRTGSVEITTDGDPVALARAFADEHGLPSATLVSLAGHIRASKRAAEAALFAAAADGDVGTIDVDGGCAPLAEESGGAAYYADEDAEAFEKTAELGGWPSSPEVCLEAPATHDSATTAATLGISAFSRLAGDSNESAAEAEYEALYAQARTQRRPSELATTATRGDNARRSFTSAGSRRGSESSLTAGSCGSTAARPPPTDGGSRGVNLALYARLHGEAERREAKLRAQSDAAAASEREALRQRRASATARGAPPAVPVGERLYAEGFEAAARRQEAAAAIRAKLAQDAPWTCAVCGGTNTGALNRCAQPAKSTSRGGAAPVCGASRPSDGTPSISAAAQKIQRPVGGFDEYMRIQLEAYK